jgi:hypothetical protein
LRNGCAIGNLMILSIELNPHVNHPSSITSGEPCNRKLTRFPTMRMKGAHPEKQDGLPLCVASAARNG